MSIGETIFALMRRLSPCLLKRKNLIYNIISQCRKEFAGLASVGV
jgi:hypothetical protein